MRRNRFKSIDLGPHEERLRQFILNEDPGEETDYPFLIIMISKEFEKTMKVPQRSRLNGHNVYFWIAAGLHWIFFVSSHVKKHDAFLKKSGEIKLFPGNQELNQTILESLKNTFRSSKKIDKEK